MKCLFTLLLLISAIAANAQTFVRSHLPTQVFTPWEITYGPDGYLWLTESGGIVSRVDPNTGDKTIVHIASDYFGGSPLEQLQTCFMPNIGSGTLGLDLHPDFLNPANAYIYFVYSYNSGTEETPSTKFKLVRLTWNGSAQTVTATTDLVSGLSSGYDHLGGRLMAITRADGKTYLFVSIGDHGISERNDPECYANQNENPNNFAQDPSTDNGKIHRFNIDGSIPNDNPIPGNSFYTRGHRNPQGLMYIPHQDHLFDVEHGDRTDDEINLLEAGMNYGWKWVRGYHGDNNFPGEAEFISSYARHPLIAEDRLMEAFYAFCAVPQPESDEYLEWCTPAPSDGIYYNSDAIPEWKHSLLIVSLKNGLNTNNEVHVLKLSPDGTTFIPSTVDNPNPQTFFAADQSDNGRLRDIAVSPDGKKIFLINNGGEGIADKITVYTVQTTSGVKDITEGDASIFFYPNPTYDQLTLQSKAEIGRLEVFSLAGKLILTEHTQFTQINVTDLADGMYIAKMYTTSGQQITKKFVKQ